MTYTMQQTCRETGLTYDTLKFYCNEGLVPELKRDKNNHRIFDEHNIAWIESLLCLKKCGMSIAEMKTYLELCLKEQKTIVERQQMLELKMKDLELKMHELQESMDFIRWKQQFYNDVLAGKTPYYSNLTLD